LESECCIKSYAIELRSDDVSAEYSRGNDQWDDVFISIPSELFSVHHGNYWKPSHILYTSPLWLTCSLIGTCRAPKSSVHALSRRHALNSTASMTISYCLERVDRKARRSSFVVLHFVHVLFLFHSTSFIFWGHTDREGEMLPIFNLRHVSNNTTAEAYHAGAHTSSVILFIRSRILSTA
jgi:hypothetical protein